MQPLTDADIDARYRLYDSGIEVYDRYTLVDMSVFRTQQYPKRRLYTWLWFSNKKLTGYCEHCEVCVWPHLGKRLTPSSFPDIRRIISDIF